jgi:hypothetical protein
MERDLAYISKATSPVLRSKVCQLQQQPGVSFIHGSPGAALLSVLGVLRRPATPADRVKDSTLLGTGQVYAGFVRRALVARGVSYYVVAVRNNRASWFPSARCVDSERAALAAYAPKIPADVRGQTLTLAAQLIAYDRQLAAHTPRDVVCIATISGNGGESQCGIGPAEIRNGVIPGDARGMLTGIVPDGVASVTLRFPAAPGRLAVSVTGPVHENMYAVYVSAMRNADAGNAIPPEPAVVWRSAAGRVLKTMPAPRPGEGARYCRRQPIPCLAAMGSYATGGASAVSTSSSSATTAAPALSTTTVGQGG